MCVFIYACVYVCANLYLHGDAPPRTAVMHEDTQHVWDQLWQVQLELSSQSHDYLFDQQDDCVLHWVVGGPVFLQIQQMRKRRLSVLF